MISGNKYLYQIELVTTRDILDFARKAAKCPYNVSLVNGHHRLSAKSFISVTLAKVSWEEIFVESDEDCFFEFEKYIK